MASRSLPKSRNLPSLLDRLVDNEPINHSLNYQKETIKALEAALAKLSADKSELTVDAKISQQRQLQTELEEARNHFALLSAVASSSEELRSSVKRDLDWLLNANQYSPQAQLEAYPYVANSVVNYGMPDLTGKTVTSFEPSYIEKLLKQVILNYEPRLIRRTLSIKVIADKTMFDHNALAFEIEGELWAEPQPLHLHLRTEFQLEDGYVSVTDYRPVWERA